MTITTYINNSENNKINKNIVKIKDYAECSAITPISIIDPVIKLNDINFNTQCNYIYIADFQRYYFVNNITALNNGLWELNCHIDVLETYANEILSQTATFKRQEYLYDMYLPDTQFQTQSKNDIVIKRFPNKDGFKLTENSFILTVAN